MEWVQDTKYANRARLEAWVAGTEDGGVIYRRGEDGKWTVIVEATRAPATIIVTSGPQDSIEAGCVAAIAALREANQTIE